MVSEGGVRPGPTRSERKPGVIMFIGYAVIAVLLALGLLPSAWGRNPCAPSDPVATATARRAAHL